jgi:hypothetical protein
MKNFLLNIFTIKANVINEAAEINNGEIGQKKELNAPKNRDNRTEFNSCCLQIFQKNNNTFHLLPNCFYFFQKQIFPAKKLANSNPT